MGVIWYKIWSDIWNNKGRTAQVVLIIAMGAFAIGMIIGASEAISTRLAEIWQASTPAMINLWTEPGIDDAQLTGLKSIKGVKEVEGYLSANLEWRFSPDEPWTSGGLIARTDYEDQTYAKVELLNGRWPARKRVAVSDFRKTAEVSETSAVSHALKFGTDPAEDQAGFGSLGVEVIRPHHLHDFRFTAPNDLEESFGPFNRLL